MAQLLAGDIGGTKTALGIFTSEAGPRAPLVEATYHSADYRSLEVLAAEFLTQTHMTVDRACFGVAGPVVAGRVATTNLPWMLEEFQLRETLKLQAVRLLNDLEAVAYAIALLEPADLHTLQTGAPMPGGAIAIIAPGTGLGEAFLTREGTQYRPHPSEGGHADFAPSNALELELLRFLQQRFDHVSYERVCSGLGLPNIYAYLKASGIAEEPTWLAAQLKGASDPTPLIINAALGDVSCDLCMRTLHVFVSILGAEASNLALKVLATGGVYVGGGIPPRIIPAFEDGRFIQAFRRKGRYAELVSQIPVHVILNSKVGLLGAARCGLDA